MSPLLGTADFLSWSCALEPHELPARRQAQPGDLDQLMPGEPDPLVFGSWHPPGYGGAVTWRDDGGER